MTDFAHFQVIILAAGCSRRLAHLTADKPKSLLHIGGKSIIEHTLNLLECKGFRRVCFVVGYRRELFMQTLGNRHGSLHIDYVISEDFATTEHGWSLYLTAPVWRRDPAPVLFMDADNLFDPGLLDLALAAPNDNVSLVDDTMNRDDREEEWVIGANGRVHALARARYSELVDVAGGFVGINRFSRAFMQTLFEFMDSFFDSHGRTFKYERVIDALLQSGSVTLHYAATEGRPWVNVNHQDDFHNAAEIAQLMRANCPPPGDTTAPMISA